MRLLKMLAMYVATITLLLSTVFVASPAHATTVHPLDGDNSQWISNSPYPTVVAGQQFSLQFSFGNDGTNTWTDAGGYGLVCDTYYHIQDVYGNGPINDCLGGSSMGLGGQVVMPGQRATFTTTLTAPNPPDGLSVEVYDAWYDMEHNGSIFGNSNVFVQVTVMPSYNEEGIGTVEIIQGGAQLYDANGNTLPTRVCPDGTQASTYVPSNWDVVRLAGLPSTSAFTVPEYQSGSGDYVLIAAPDPCQPRLDFSDNQSANNGTGAIGYMNVNALEVAQSVVPVISNARWQNCWPPLQCSDSTSFSGLNNSLAQGSVMGYGEGPNVPGIPFVKAWVTNGGAGVDPHWWAVYNDARNPASVYGRDWSAQT